MIGFIARKTESFAKDTRVICFHFACCECGERKALYLHLCVVDTVPYERRAAHHANDSRGAIKNKMEPKTNWNLAWPLKMHPQRQTGHPGIKTRIHSAGVENDQFLHNTPVCAMTPLGKWAYNCNDSHKGVAGRCLKCTEWHVLFMIPTEWPTRRHERNTHETYGK